MCLIINVCFGPFAEVFSGGSDSGTNDFPVGHMTLFVHDAKFELLRIFVTSSMTLARMFVEYLRGVSD